jgi:hypothetical protein
MSTGDPLAGGMQTRGPGDMIVIETDPHEQSHTAAKLIAGPASVDRF